MRLIAITLSLIAISLSSFSTSNLKIDVNEKTSCEIDCPANWKSAPRKELAGNVLAYIYAKSYHFIPPNINLTVQKNCSFKQEKFFKEQRQVFEDTGLYNWSYLGTLSTNCGTAHLVFIEGEAQLGKACILQAILPHKKDIYFITATSNSEEFSAVYPLFISSLQSFSVNEKL